jgi:hypothetical protein
MARFLIEVPHESDTVACAHAVRVFLETGSHFLTNADLRGSARECAGDRGIYGNHV